MAGYSGTPLAKKLGIKAGYSVLFINQPGYYLALFDDMPEVVEVGESDEDINFIHFFTKCLKELKQQFPILKKQLKKDGTLWVSWPKKSAKVETDLDGNIVRSKGLDVGLVDVKVCAVDDTWSGLKFMYRKEDR